ncbi:MAG: helix-turn-helix domain-containing protein [Cyclonatronaceae bacterium]
MQHLPYKVIKSRTQYDDYCRQLEEMLFSEEAVARENEIDLLTLLIEDFDARQRVPAHSDPVTLVKALMEAHGLNQAQLADIVGCTKGYVSEMLSYKKGLSKNVIRAIANHFKISQDALNQEYGLVENDAEPAT